MITDYDSVRAMVLEDEAMRFQDNFKEFLEKERRDTLTERKVQFEKLESEFR